MIPSEKILKIKKLFLVLIGSVLALSSCSDDPSSIGVDILGGDLIKVVTVNSETDSISQNSHSVIRALKLGNSERLLLGKKDNAEASILIKFAFGLLDSVKNDILNNKINVISAQIEFAKNYLFVDQAAPLVVSMHKITNNWSSTDFTADSLPKLNYQSMNEFISSTLGDSLDVFKFNEQLAQEWLLSAVDSTKPDNYGIFIKPDASSQKIVGYQALSARALNIPRLRLVLEKPGVYTDTLSFFPTADLSVVTGTIPSVGAENLAIQAGMAVEAKVWFDISSIPSNAIIVSANFKVFSDTTEFISSKNFTNGLRALDLADSSSLTLTKESAVTLIKDSTGYGGDIASFVQNWVKTKNNQGFLVTAFDEGSGVDIFAIKNSNSSDITKRPKLIITYTIAK